MEAENEAGNTAKATADSLNIVNFLKYHIQDNALYIGAEPESGDFETSLFNKTDKRFYMVRAALKDDTIEVEDGQKIKHTVTKKNDVAGRPLYNIQAREYLYNSNDATTATSLYTTSSAVIHLIDSPLSW